ncbi:MAG: hydrogenase maturation protease [Lewinellaceae bacterium]|nr:hydrogenase maturation protease [Lewinellaceae bacterium]
MKNKVLLLGIGNYLMGDEGLGVYIANRLTTHPLPEGVAVLDGGTSGLHMMGLMEQYPVVIMADATLDGQPAGTIQLLEPRFSSDFPRAMSTHDLGLRDVIDGLTIMGRLPKIYLYVVSVEEVQPMTIGLTQAVQAAADKIIDDILFQIKNNTLAAEPSVSSVL